MTYEGHLIISNANYVKNVRMYKYPRRKDYKNMSINTKVFFKIKYYIFFRKCYINCDITKKKK